MVAPEERTQGLKDSQQSTERLLRYLSQGQSGGLTDQPDRHHQQQHHHHP